LAHALLDRQEIQSILPHRKPFLFVESIQEIEPGKRILGELHVDPNELFLMRDGEPYLPPTILAEAMAQVGAILVLYPEDNRGRTIYFRSIEQAEFTRRVEAGEVVLVEANVRKMRARFGSLDVTATVDGEPAASAVMSFALGP
jgi:3-hydroxyacyl-[acyl-carrier-protein] dehydratase